MLIDDPELRFLIALNHLPGVGPRVAKNLMAHCGSAQNIFENDASFLAEISGINRTLVPLRGKKEALKRADEELEFIAAKQVIVHSYLEAAYPERLKLCEDGPLLLFQKGPLKLNNSRSLAVVGTRNATEYGRDFCDTLLLDLQELQPQIISGLAYGIDTAAHRGALRYRLPTIAVMAHGLDRVYPYLNRKLSEQILEQGGALVTEFCSGTNPDRENFPKRNRIIAGMAEATLVVEAGKKGGALITAELANDYHREVFALPGDHNRPFSEGCNLLIKSHRAHLLTSAADLRYILGWEKKQAVQLPLDFELENPEKALFDLIPLDRPGIELEVLSVKLNSPPGKVLANLMSLELKGLIKALPGKRYCKN